MRVEFLIGTNNLVDRIGILEDVGASYILLRSVENASLNTTTKLPLYFLSILFLVFAIIFLIKFVKYQLKRKNKLSK